MHPLRIEHPEAKCPRHFNKEYRQLIEAAWAAGWWCERRRKYIYCRPPDPEIATSEDSDDAEKADDRKRPVEFSPGRIGGVASMAVTVTKDETDVTAEFEMNVDLELQESEPVSEDVLDAHADEVSEAIERAAPELALGHVNSFDVRDSKILLLFDVIGDSDAEIYEKLAEVIRVILRETGLPLRVARVEAREIDAEARAADLEKFRASQEEDAV